MDKEYLKKVFNRLGGSEKGWNFDSFVKRMSTDADYNSKVFNKLGGNEKGWNKDSFDSKVGLKKKASSQDSEMESQPSGESSTTISQDTKDSIEEQKLDAQYAEQPTVDEVIEEHDGKLPTEEDTVEKSVESITARFTKPVQEYEQEASDYDSTKVDAIKTLKEIQKANKPIYVSTEQEDIEDGIAIQKQDAVAAERLNLLTKELYDKGSATLSNARKAFKVNYIEENPDIVQELESEDEEVVEKANEKIYDAWLKQPEILSGTERVEKGRNSFEVFYDSFQEGMEERDFNLMMARDLADATDEEAKIILEKKYQQYLEDSKDIDSPYNGFLQEDLPKMFGTQAVPIATTATLGVIPGFQPAAILYSSGDAAATSYGAEFMGSYMEARNQGKSEEESYEIANKQAYIGGGVGAVEGFLGAFTGGVSTKFGGKVAQKFGSKAIKPLVAKAAEGTSDAGLDAAAAGIGQMVNNGYAQSQGLDRGLFDGVADEMIGEIIFSGTMKLPKTVTTVKDFKKYIKELPPKEQQKIFNNVLDNKENLERKILNDKTNVYLDLKSKEAEQDGNDKLVSEIKERPLETLKNDLSRLNKVKENISDETAVKEIDKNIDALNVMIDNIEQRVVVKEGESENIYGTEEMTKLINDEEFIEKVANGDVDVEVENNEEIGKALNEKVEQYKEQKDDSETQEQVPSTKQEGEAVEQTESIEEPSGEETETSGVVQEKQEVKLFHGKKKDGKKIIDEVDKSYDKVLVLPKDQLAHLQELADNGDETAAKILESDNKWMLADEHIKRLYGDKYDAIKYEQKDSKKPEEYYDTKEDRFYSVSETYAKIAGATADRSKKYKDFNVKEEYDKLTTPDTDINQEVESQELERKKVEEPPTTPPVETDRPDVSGDDKEKVVDSISAYARKIIPNRALRKSEVTPLLTKLEKATTEKQFNEILDKIEEVAVKAEKRARMNKLNKVKKIAKKNIKEKLGRIAPQVKTILEAESVPDELMDEYESVVNTLGERAEVLSVDLEAVNDLYKKIAEIREVKDDSFAQEVEIEETKKPKEVKMATEEDLENLNEKRKLIKPKDVSFENDDIDMLAIKLLKLPKEYLQTLTSKQVNNIARETENIANGFISNKFSYDVVNNYEAKLAADGMLNAKNDLGRKNDDESFEKGVDDLKNLSKEELDVLNKEDKELTKKEKKFKKRVSNRMLQHIDRFVGSIKNTKFYNEIVSPFSRAEGAKERAVNKVSKNINNLVSKAIKGKVGKVNFMLAKTQEAHYRLNAMLDMFLIEKQHQDNPGSKKTPSLKEVIDRITKAHTSGEARLAPNDFKIIQELYNDVSKDGEIDLDKFENEYMTEDERNVLKYIQEEYKNHQGKFEYLSLIRGDSPEMIESYARRASMYSGGNELDASSFYDNMTTGGMNASFKTGSMNERVSGTPLVRLGAINNFMNYVNEVNTDYYYTPAVKKFNSVMKNLDEQGNKSTKMIAQATKQLIRQNINDSYKRSSTSVSNRTKFMKIFMSNVSKKILINALRVPQEISNLLVSIPNLVPHAFDKNKSELRNKTSELGVFDMIQDKYGTNQAERLTGGYSVDYKDTDITKTLKSGLKSTDVNTSEKAIDFLKSNLATDFGNWATEKYYKMVDAALSPGWQYNFLENFKKVSGKDFNPEAYKNDAEYRADVDNHIKEAAAITDKDTSDYYNTATRFEQKIKGKDKDPMNILNLMSNFMQSFTFNEQSVLTDAAKSMAGRGTMTRGEAAAKFASLSLRAVAYQMIGDSIYQLVSGSDIDEEEFDKILDRAGVNYLMLFTIGNLPAWAKTLLGNTVNLAAEEYTRVIKGEKYDPYKDNLAFGNELSSAKDVYGLFGSFGDVIRTGDEMLKLFNDVTEKLRKGEDVTDEDVVRLKVLQTIYNVTATGFGLPGYKDVKGIQKLIEREYGIERGKKKSKKKSKLKSGLGGSIKSGL